MSDAIVGSDQVEAMIVEVCQAPLRWLNGTDFRTASSADFFVFYVGANAPSEPVVQRLSEAAEAATLVASVSVLTVQCGGQEPAVFDMPPMHPPTVALPDDRLILLTRHSLESIPSLQGDHLWSEGLTIWSRSAQRMGWRHIGAPGTAICPNESSPAEGPTNLRAYERSTDTDKNALLEAHRLWSEVHIRPLRLAVDGTWARSEPLMELRHPIRELDGRIFGVVGWGELGRGTARIAEAFGMNETRCRSSPDRPGPGARIRSGVSPLRCQHSGCCEVRSVAILRCRLPTVSGVLGARASLVPVRGAAIRARTTRCDRVLQSALLPTRRPLLHGPQPHPRLAPTGGWRDVHLGVRTSER